MNGFRATKALQHAIDDPRVEDVEGEGCDPGRVFIHLKPGYEFRGYDSRTKTVGSVIELREMMSRIQKRDVVLDPELYGK